MDNEIYKIANQIVDEYENRGINGHDLIEYLNQTPKNFENFVNRVSEAGGATDTELVTEICKDVIRDRFALINDTKE